MASARVACGTVTDFTGHTEPLLQQWTGRRVLQVDLLARPHVLLDREGGEGCFMEAGKNQLLLPRIVVDIPDSIDARNVGLETVRVHGNGAPMHRQAPLRNRSELR